MPQVALQKLAARACQPGPVSETAAVSTGRPHGGVYRKLPEPYQSCVKQAMRGDVPRSGLKPAGKPDLNTQVFEHKSPWSMQTR